MIGKSRDKSGICGEASKQIAEFGDLRFLQATFQVFGSFIQVRRLWDEAQPFCSSQHGSIQTHDVAAQDFMQHKIPDERRDVGHFFERLDSLFQCLSSKFFEVVRIRRFENGSQNGTDAQPFPVRLVERCEHDLKFVDRTHTNFVQVKKCRDHLLQTSFCRSPRIILKAGGKEHRFNDRQFDLWNRLAIKLVKRRYKPATDLRLVCRFGGLGRSHCGSLLNLFDKSRKQAGHGP